MPKTLELEPTGSARRQLAAITLMTAVGLGAPAVFAQQGEQPAPAPQQQAPAGPSRARNNRRRRDRLAPQQGAPGQAAPAETKLTERQFKDWTVRCGRQNEQGPEVCEMQQQQTDKEGRTVMAVAVGKVPGSSDLGLLIMVPLGVLLPAGVMLQIDSGAEMPLQVNRCERQGCRIEMLLKPDLLARLKSGSQAKVFFEAFDPQGERRRLGIPISLLGFTAALERSGELRSRESPRRRRPTFVVGPGQPCQRAAASSSALRASTQRLCSGGLLEFPERRLGLQPVDQEGAGFEGWRPMRRGGRDQHDRLARQHPAVTVNDQARLQRPARVRLRLDLGELLLGHPGIMLQRHRRDRLAAMGAHQPDEAGERADVGATGGQRRELGANVERLLLDANHHACARRSRLRLSRR